ncbi:MAG: hypothetical protein QGD93_12250, partial [Actinomycetota bacterium]|nr:hypothetical protein [Actinomycetota bacterium]
RHADPKRVRPYEVLAATVIEVGDLVYQEVDDIRPASALTYGASLANAQGNFAKNFKGVAMTASASGDTLPVSVATRGTFEFVCAAAQFEIGDRMADDDNGGGDALENQQVIAAGENGLGAIAEVTKRYSANTTSVQVELLEPALANLLIPITLVTVLIQNAVDLVTDWVVPFPFKLVRVDAVVNVLTAGVLTMTIDNGSQALDDTITVGDASAVGVSVETLMDDATGDDVFEMGDTLSIRSNGTPTAGEISVILWVRPFLSES